MFVKYKLSAQDAEEINRRRVSGFLNDDWPAGAQAHVGNDVNEGEVYPAVVVLTLQDDLVNLQVFLDGNDSFWATSRSEGANTGEWFTGM